jgi:hypothetical protein
MLNIVNKLTKVLKGGEPMKKMHLFLVVLVLFSFILSGCYYFSAKKGIANAEKSIAELKAAGGDKSAPYDYCSAENFLVGAKKEFNENHFKPSTELSNRSTSAAEAGLATIKKK